MRGTDFQTMRDAVTHCKGAVLGLAGYVEAAAAVHPNSGQDVVAEGWSPPTWAAPGQFVTRHRLLDVGKPVLERVLSGWEAPDVAAVAAVDLDDRELEREFYQAREAFVAAAAVAAVALAAHGEVYHRHLEDGTAFRRVAAGSWPEQSQAEVPVARVALDRFVLAWLAVAGRLDGAAFLPGGRR